MKNGLVWSSSSISWSPRKEGMREEKTTNKEDLETAAVSLSLINRLRRFFFGLRREGPAVDAVWLINYIKR